MPIILHPKTIVRALDSAIAERGGQKEEKVRECRKGENPLSRPLRGSVLLMSNELSTSDLQSLRQALEQVKAELSGGLVGSAEAAKPVELDQPAIGRVSRIDAIQQQKMLEANRAAQKGRLSLIRAALIRLDEDDYGDCGGCGECIGLARLSARPESVFCIECQQAREKR